MGRQSSTSDGGSWEAVEEADARPQLWVPDYAAQRCTGCDTEFWLGRRRHHCRCGSGGRPAPTASSARAAAAAIGAEIWRHLSGR